MNRLILFVLLICCCVQSTYAQSDYDLMAIRNISSAIMLDTAHVNKDCIDQVKVLQDELKKATDTLTRITAATNYINTLASQDFKTQCPDPRFQQLLGKLNHLVSRLKIKSQTVLVDSTKQIAGQNLSIIQNVILKLSAKDIDNKRTISAINIVIRDTTQKNVPVVIKNGIATATLMPGRKYLVHVAAANYKDIDTSFALQKSRTIALGMSAKDAPIIPVIDTHKTAVAAVPEDSPEVKTVKVENEPISTSANEEKNLITTLYVLAGSLLALLLAVTIAYIIHKRKSAAAQHFSNNEFKTKEAKYKTEINSKDAIISELNNNIAVLQSKEETAIPQPPTVIAGPEPLQKNFVCELMMTAGPRKKIIDGQTSDIDLGEDVCGWVTSGDKATVWVLDGTSDLHFLKSDDSEYFSSRLLAKAIGDKIRKYTIDAQVLSLDQMIDKAIDEVKVEWNKIINALPGKEKELLVKNISESNFPECASTMMIARLSMDGGFEGYRSGDSKMLLYGKNGNEKNEFIDTSLSTKNDEANDRIFFRIMLNEGELGIVNNKPLYEVVKKSNVQSLIMFSDGIGSSTETLLKNHYADEPEKARDDIARQVQGTNDDKTICFVEIR